VKVGGSDNFAQMTVSGKVTGKIRVKSLDRRLVAAVYRESARYRIDPELVFSLIWQESGGKLHAISPKGARGPLQLMPGTAAKYGVRNPFDPDQAVRGGLAYFVDLLDEFNGNVSQALAGYNAGMVPVYAFLHGKRVVLSNNKVVNPRGIKTVGGIPPYRETENYVESIASNYRKFRQAENMAAVSVQTEK
jgi:soluble lytic murein transglycosylase-like protein